MSEAGHIPVLPTQVVDALSPRPGETFVDCTAGLGGHAARIADELGSAGTVVLNDLDPGNLARASERVRATFAGRVEAICGNFAELPRTLAARGMRANMVLADLGFASNQVEAGERGFSFSREGPLDMRLGPALRTTAADLVASLPEAELARIISEYGEERHAGRIARKLVQARDRGPISTTTQLAAIVRAAAPSAPGSIDPATRTFQALRIAVNDELGNLEALLAAVERDAKRGAGQDGEWLARGARVAIISFHSLEDRAVKQAFARLGAEGCEVLTPRPRVAEEDEVRANARSRSAKLRVVRLASS